MEGLLFLLFLKEKLTNQFGGLCIQKVPNTGTSSLLFLWVAVKAHLRPSQQFLTFCVQLSPFRSNHGDCGNWGCAEADPNELDGEEKQGE
jgi:hypothetical protein